MPARIRPKITYANVVASLALFVALGGVSYAAITIPNGSVGTKQLKSNAVTSAKVKKGTLQRSDFAAGALPATGTNGANGAPGAPGAKGDKGEDADLGLLDPNNYLPGAGTAQLSINGSVVATVRGYRIDCVNNVCTLSVGKPMDSNIELDAWYEVAQLDPTSAVKSFSITEFTGGGTAVRRYHVTEGLPIARRTLNERLEIKFSSAFIQRVAI